MGVGLRCTEVREEASGGGRKPDSRMEQTWGSGLSGVSAPLCGVLGLRLAASGSPHPVLEPMLKS